LSLPVAFLLVALGSILGNRIIAIGLGLWFHLPPGPMLGILILLDLLQIPMYYWLYEHSHQVLARLPSRIGQWFERMLAVRPRAGWTQSLGGFGVMLIAALPSFGGGMWSAIFLAYGLKLRRSASYVWLMLGSFSGYLLVYWVCDTIARTLRFLTVA
jgi:uncharacterized membrane protein